MDGAAYRREDLLGLMASPDKQIDKLDAAVERVADEHPQARLLMTQPGVGPITSHKHRRTFLSLTKLSPLLTATEVTTTPARKSHPSTYKQKANFENQPWR